MRECIRGFDEAISLKANKTIFKIMTEEFENRYIHVDKWDMVLKRFDELKIMN